MNSACVYPHIHFKAPLIQAVDGSSMTAGGLGGAPVRGHSHPAHKPPAGLLSEPGNLGLAGR